LYATWLLLLRLLQQGGPCVWLALSGRTGAGGIAVRQERFDERIETRRRRALS